MMYIVLDERAGIGRMLIQISTRRLSTFALRHYFHIVLVSICFDTAFFLWIAAALLSQVLRLFWF